MPLQVTIANKHEQGVVRNLLQMYLHEQCPFTHQELQDDGLFEYPGFDDFFGEGDKTAYLFRLKGRLAGFALMRDQETIDGQKFHTITDIFLIDTYRKWGVGEECARVLFERYEGLWRIAVRDQNPASMGFWRNVIWRYAGKSFKQLRYPDFEGLIFEFTSPTKGLEAEPMESVMDRPIVRRPRTRFV
jgi:predicted acetyltransferase